MKVTLNGENKEFDGEMTVSKLLEVLDIPVRGIAVEINREIIPKTTHEKAQVKDGDVIEIVRMVGGGCL